MKQFTNYTFQNPMLLKQALSHPCGLDPKETEHYERLEFLGDRVLNFLISEALFHRYPKASEGELAKRLNHCVCKDALVLVAQHLDLSSHMILPAGERAVGAHHNPTLLADTCEALLAAIYLDGGWEAARAFSLPLWSGLLEGTVVLNPLDAKSELQEYSQQNGYGLPHYAITRLGGTDHDPLFEATVTVNTWVAQGRGPNKKLAERAAAVILLAQLQQKETLSQ